VDFAEKPGSPFWPWKVATIAKKKHEKNSYFSLKSQVNYNILLNFPNLSKEEKASDFHLVEGDYF